MNHSMRRAARTAPRLPRSAPPDRERAARPGGRLLSLLCAAALGTAQAAGSATQTIHFHFGALSRADLGSKWVPLSASGGPGSAPQAQGVGRLSYLRNQEVRLLVDAAQAPAGGTTLNIRVSGADPALDVGGSTTALITSALLPGGDHTLDLQYALVGTPPGAPPPVVVYTFLDP